MRDNKLDKAQVGIPASYPAFFTLEHLRGARILKNKDIDCFVIGDSADLTSVLCD